MRDDDDGILDRVFGSMCIGRSGDETFERVRLACSMVDDDAVLIFRTHGVELCVDGIGDGGVISNGVINALSVVSMFSDERGVELVMKARELLMTKLREQGVFVAEYEMPNCSDPMAN